MKRLTALLLCLCMCAPFACVSARASSFAVAPTPLWDENGQIGSVDLRFYTDKPHVAYIGINAFMAAMTNEELTVTPQEDKTWLVANDHGYTLLVNPASGTVYAEDWNSFQKNGLQYIREKRSIKDTSCSWTAVDGIDVTGEPKPVTFDFAKYGIDIYADKNDVYFPLALLTDMMEEESLDLLLYNGEKLQKCSINMDNIYTLADGYFESDYMRKMLNGETPRAADLIRESYAELCFVMDYFYGHPGRGTLDKAIAEKGLDTAISDLPNGESIREQLHSADIVEYYDGLNDLICDGLYDGHTTIQSLTMIETQPLLYQNTYFGLMGEILDGLSRTWATLQLGVNGIVSSTRESIWGTETYRECGSTAIIRMDNFNPDEKGWLAWAAGTGEMPMDTLGIVYTGLEKAAANPAIRNVIFDLTLNTGGSQDLLCAILGLIDDNVDLCGYNVLTDQQMNAHFLTDKNMDGVIDEQDKTAKYHFNYAVLTSWAAFSCGNLFPFMIRDLGGAVIGEASGGGSCVVQIIMLSDGTPLTMSSYLWRLEDENGIPIEGGAQPDILLEGGKDMGDYSKFYDDEMLDRVVTEWFAGKEE